MNYHYHYILFITFAVVLITVSDPGFVRSAPIYYPEHIDGPFTGGFGEENCRSCHFDYELNHPDGSIEINGLDSTYIPGSTYTIRIELSRQDMLMAGFQLTSRFIDGTQAGNFEPGDSLTFTPGIDSDIQYLQHAIGITAAHNGKKRWSVTWSAPERNSGDVIFNIAANAANGDRSEFGDWIFVKEIRMSGLNE